MADDVRGWCGAQGRKHAPWQMMLEDGVVRKGDRRAESGTRAVKVSIWEKSGTNVSRAKT